MLFCFSGCSSKAQAIPDVEMTTEELAKFDGKEGRPLYVAVHGVIYDLTNCRYWKDGKHTSARSRFSGGRDLTEELKSSLHGMRRVRQFPPVGRLK